MKWWEVEEKLLNGLTSAVWACDDITLLEKQKWMWSTTHREVYDGILDLDQHENESLCYAMDINDIDYQLDHSKEKVNFGRYIDVEPGKRSPDLEKQMLLSNLRRDVKGLNVGYAEIGINWNDKDKSDSAQPQKYKQLLGKKIVLDLKSRITDAMHSKPKNDSCIQEIAAHVVVCEERAKMFHGRDELVQKGLSYFRNYQGGNSPWVIYGNSGAGKTGLVSKLYVECKKTLTTSNTEPLFILKQQRNWHRISSHKITKSL